MVGGRSPDRRPVGHCSLSYRAAVGAARQANDNLIVISWPYQGVESGMPNEEDKQHTNNFEEAIEKGFEDSPSGCRWRA